jgi:hypothetical protein
LGDEKDTALADIAAKLDLILGVLLTQGKSTDETLRTLEEFGFESPTIAKLAQVSGLRTHMEVTPAKESCQNGDRVG